ncbi:helix-turn-helix domain-containing protein [Aromatoleum aromaticum]|uniref:helix-turn-helix domain-containing protein n=1 Tax=Aromatoleum aromaticum TaxID=551760 RepID=UPI0024100B0A|nr:winged helix-turn-helix domain-containing protein [Aromatoleum aromaticum]
MWTRAMVRNLIRTQFKVAMSEVSVGRLLHKQGLSPQRPLMRAYQRDPALVNDWIKDEFPHIRSEAKSSRGGHLLRRRGCGALGLSHRDDMGAGQRNAGGKRPVRASSSI